MTTHDLPFVSVVLPVRNEAGYIERCLRAVLAQDYPQDRLEIIAADGQSTDGTGTLLRECAARYPALTVLENTGRIVPTGLNLAIGQARGDVIVRVDGHCEIAPDYVRRCVAHLRDGADAVGGPLETIGETPMARAIALAMGSPFGVGNAAFRTVKDRTMTVDTVAFPAWPRAVLDRLGPFDEELVRNQDDEYNSRLREQGGTIRLAADIRSRYYGRASLRSLWRQYYQYGYWKVRVLQLHPRQMCLRQFVPPAFVLALLVLGLGALASSRARVGLAGLVGLYAAATLLQSLRLAARMPVQVLRLLAVFPALHVAYGAGFLRGLVAFRGRWRTTLRRHAPVAS
jgi:glycosyltransferase involved in cell wall biosynthesis